VGEAFDRSQIAERWRLPSACSWSFDGLMCYAFELSPWCRRKLIQRPIDTIGIGSQSSSIVEELSSSE
jgi:hypothetical protein